MDGLKNRVVQTLGKVPLVVFFLVLPIFPFLPYSLQASLVVACAYGFFAMSWDLMSGVVGYVSFGHGLLFAIGPYLFFILTTKLGYSAYVSLPVAVIGGIIIGMVLFLPSLRLEGMYFTLASLLILLAADSIIITGLNGVPIIPAFRDITGGTYGLFGPPLFIHTLGVRFLVYLVLLVSIGSFVVYEFEDRLGEIYKGMRESEELMESIGIHTTKFRMYAFLVSVFLAVLGGIMLAQYLEAIAPPTFFALTPILFVIFMCVIGGFRTLWGAVLGAFVLRASVWVMRIYELGHWTWVILGIISLAFIYYAPEGLGPLVRKKIGS